MNIMEGDTRVTDLKAGNRYIIPNVVGIHVVAEAEHMDDGQVIIKSYEQMTLYRQYTVRGFEDTVKVIKVS